MKKLAFGAVAVVAMASLVGCSSSEEDAPPPAPDFAAIEQRFENPDGTLSGGNVKSVLWNATGSGALPMFGGMSTSSGQSDTQSFGLRPRANAFEGCAAPTSGQRTGSCACPEGGSLSWDYQGGGNASSSDVTMRFGLDACGVEGSVIDGSQYVRIQSSGSGKSASFSMLTVMDATVTKDGQTHKFDFQVRMKNNELELAAKVDDGWVVVSVSASADRSQFTVRARNGSWTCASGADGSGACTSSTGETVAYGA